MRVHGDAVPADRDARLVDVAERLAVAGLDDLSNVDAVPVGGRASSLAKAMLMSRYVVSASFASSAASVLPRSHTPLRLGRSSRWSNCRACS